MALCVALTKDASGIAWMWYGCMFVGPRQILRFSWEGHCDSIDEKYLINKVLRHRKAGRKEL